MSDPYVRGLLAFLVGYTVTWLALLPVTVYVVRRWGR